METKGSVLIVDDELGARESMRMILKGKFDVSTAESGMKAIELVKEKQYDVVVLDIRMPDISGIEVLEKIKQMDPSPEVMMVTAYAALDTAKNAMRLGAYDYIEKPFKNFDEFREVVNKGVERKLKASKIYQLVAQLEKLSTIGQMASEIMHELATPITGVIGYSEFLLSQECNDTIKDSLKKINAEAERCQKIIKNVLSFTRKPDVGKSYVDINDIIIKTIDLKSHHLKLDNIKIALDLNQSMPKTMANYNEIQQVLVNIINNAHYAMKSKETEKILSIKTWFDFEKIYISLANTGPSIPQDKLEVIFEPYYTTKKTGNGTGLGLSISRRIINEHNGRIYAESKEDEGVRFIIELPIFNEI